MIGQVRFTVRGDSAIAVLHDDGRWECSGSPSTANTLNRDFSPVGKPSASGNWGEWELFAAAHYLKGIASLPGVRP
jgi:hypothetical protein